MHFDQLQRDAGGAAHILVHGLDERRLAHAARAHSNTLLAAKPSAKRKVFS